MHVGLGPLALAFILGAGGCGFFRRRAVQAHVASGELVTVRNAPDFAYPAFAVYAADSENAALRPALAALRTGAAALQNPDATAGP